MPVAGSFRQLLPSGHDRWTAEALRALLFASELDERLEIDTLIVFDVYDLLALNATLRARMIGAPVGCHPQWPWLFATRSFWKLVLGKLRQLPWQPRLSADACRSSPSASR